jgi:hypothetical protein
LLNAKSLIERFNQLDNGYDPMPFDSKKKGKQTKFVANTIA